MTDPAGITVIRREGAHAELRFAVTIWTCPNRTRLSETEI